jgi:hypothetical protein
MIESRVTGCCMAAVLLASLAGPCSGADDWKKALQKKLEGSFPLSQIGYKGSIKSAGVLVVLQADGIQGDLQDSLTLPTNVFEDGKLSVGGAFLSSLGNAGGTAGSGARVLGTGQKLYIQSIGVKNEEIKFIVFTADQKESAILGTTRAYYMKAAIAFRFREGLESMEYDALLKPVRRVLLSPDAASAPKNISLGQTTAEVEQSLGKPEKIVNLGAKAIYTYKDLKVIFVDGKVSDVQ